MNGLKSKFYTFKEDNILRPLAITNKCITDNRGDIVGSVRNDVEEVKNNPFIIDYEIYNNDEEVEEIFNYFLIRKEDIIITGNKYDISCEDGTNIILTIGRNNTTIFVDSLFLIKLNYEDTSFIRSILIVDLINLLCGIIKHNHNLI